MCMFYAWLQLLYMLTSEGLDCLLFADSRLGAAIVPLELLEDAHCRCGVGQPWGLLQVYMM